MKTPLLASIVTLATASAVLANGGASPIGIPATGSGSAGASNKPLNSSVTIESETLKIDLHAEYAAVEVHYHMHNTGPKVQQDFFFPIERWDTTPEGGESVKPADLDHYQISADSRELKWTNFANAKPVVTQLVKSETWQENFPVIKSWKKSVIPFERNQTREITIRYGSRYCEIDESVSDDLHISDAIFVYSLSPAATWNGPIGKGKIDINILHPEPEDVSIVKPTDRFRKTSDTHYEWSFENLYPSLADNIRIVAHSKFDRYWNYGKSEEERAANTYYIVRGQQYFLDHTDYDAVASSTLAPQGKEHYDVENIKGCFVEGSPWAEGVEGDGIGENITLNVKRPLPLYGILILPGYARKNAWFKNNRIAALEITLNDEQTFTETIPDEPFQKPYLIRVRNYTKPVNKIKLVIKGVHRGTQFRDTCISLIELRAVLSKKPEIVPAG